MGVFVQDRSPGSSSPPGQLASTRFALQWTTAGRSDRGFTPVEQQTEEVPDFVCEEMTGEQPHH